MLSVPDSRASTDRRQRIFEADAFLIRVTRREPKASKIPALAPLSRTK
jgi:hypothetical protein